MEISTYVPSLVDREEDAAPLGASLANPDELHQPVFVRKKSTFAWASFISVGWKAPNRLVPLSLSICDLNTLTRCCSQGPFLLLVIVLF